MELAQCSYRDGQWSKKNYAEHFYDVIIVPHSENEHKRAFLQELALEQEEQIKGFMPGLTM